jgi:hypothetical protein
LKREGFVEDATGVEARRGSGENYADYITMLAEQLRHRHAEGLGQALGSRKSPSLPVLG